MERKYDILSSVAAVVQTSKYVSINKNNIIKLLPLLKTPMEVPQVGDEYLSNFGDENKARFLLINEAIAFCFWGDISWGINYQGKDITGFWAMIMALIRALEEGYNILDFNYLKDISFTDFEHILRGNTRLSLLEERYRIIKEIANTVVTKLNNHLYNYLIQANSIEELLQLITDTFEGFRDISYYHQKEVYFLKRATLLANDLYRTIPTIKEKVKSNDALYACADYKIPQVLRNNGVLEYSSKLSEIIDNKEQIPHDSDMEIEIRANTIWAIELIKEELKKVGINMNSIDIDTAIWLLSKTKEQKTHPYHLTETIYY